VRKEGRSIRDARLKGTGVDPADTVDIDERIRCSVEGSLQVQEKSERSEVNLDEFTQRFREMRGTCTVRSQQVILNVWTTLNSKVVCMTVQSSRIHV